MNFPPPHVSEFLGRNLFPFVTQEVRICAAERLETLSFPGSEGNLQGNGDRLLPGGQTLSGAPPGLSLAFGVPGSWEAAQGPRVTQIFLYLEEMSKSRRPVACRIVGMLRI